MATHSSILAWSIPWTEELVGYGPQGHKELSTTEAPWDAHTRVCSHSGSKFISSCTLEELLRSEVASSQRVCVYVCVLYFNNHCYILLQTSCINLYSCERKIDKSNHFSTPSIASFPICCDETQYPFQFACLYLIVRLDFYFHMLVY